MESLKEVDWSKAPDGATHYNEECFCPWLKETPPSYFALDKKVWVKYSPNRPGTIEDHFSNAVKRPQEWDGSGVPPVGTVCEYRLNEYDFWFTCKITYILLGSDHCFVAWCDHLGSEQFFSFASSRYKLQLRKIKTPKQIAEEERLHAIDDMMSLVGRYSTFKDVMGDLYDAGYRKEPVKRDQKPLTTEELKAGSWWCDDVSEECRLVFEGKGINTRSGSWAGDGPFESCYIDNGTVKRSHHPEIEFLQIHRVGNDFYWI